MAGKVVAITGGNTGLGKETAVKLAALGADVIILCRNPSRADAAIAEIKERSGWECMNVRRLFDVDVLPLFPLLLLGNIIWLTSTCLIVISVEAAAVLCIPRKFQSTVTLVTSLSRYTHTQSRSKLVTALPLDLSDLENVAKCTDKLKTYLGSSKIDVLVNNAGIMALPNREVRISSMTPRTQSANFTDRLNPATQSPPRTNCILLWYMTFDIWYLVYGIYVLLKITKNGFEMQFGVNHLGHFALTALLLGAGLLSRGDNGKEAARYMPS